MIKELTFRNGRFELSGDAPIGNVWEHERQTGIFRTENPVVASVFRKWADEKAERIFERTLVKHYPFREEPPAFLDPHQKEGLRWIMTRSRSYLAHAPGAGKTAQAVVGALFTEALGQVLFIVPPSLTVNWARETAKFCELAYQDFGLPMPRHSISIIPVSSKRAQANWKAEFIICPDSMLHKEWVLKGLTRMKKRFVAVDEASRFKNPAALRTLMLFGGKKGKASSPGLIQGARHAVLLDGSPMSKRPIELWAPVYAMAGETINFMTHQEYGFRYCGARMGPRGQWEFKWSCREEELRAKLKKSFMHVVTEEELKHPERRRSMLFMSEDVRSAEQKTWEARHLPDESEVLGEEDSQGEMARFRAELGERKVPWAASYVHDRLEESDESIVLFAWHREVVLKLAHRLRQWVPGVVMGGTPSSEREIIFKNFQSGKRRLIIGNIGAMGRGNNLQRGDRAVFAEWSWSDEENRQAEKRISRRGNEKAFMRADYIVCPNSMDEIVLKSVFSGARNVKRIIG